MNSLPRSIGRYEIAEQLGEGGMGILYLARDPLLSRTVAIKILSGFNEELRERFAREAKAAAALKHRHIVTIYDVGEQAGRPFIAMEYLDGETLGELIRRRPPLSITRRLDLVLQLCDGLGYAHRAGIIHRDIKPANLMIETDGALKILDFGLARIVSEATGGLTRAGAVLGTPHYMSPEQIDGGAIDRRSDIFSVGLVFYELMTYAKAFNADSAHAVLHRIIHHPSPHLRDMVPDADIELDRIITRAIEKDPERRYQNLETMSADIDRVRTRLIREASDSTVIVEPARLPEEWLPSPRRKRRLDGSDETPGPRTPRVTPSLEAISRRRSAEISSWVGKARQALNDERYDEANEYCAKAALLDPHDARVIELFEQTHRAMEHRAEREAAVDRARAVRNALSRAQASLTSGAPEAALRSINDALAHDPANTEARQFKERVLSIVEERDAFQGAVSRTPARERTPHPQAVTGDTADLRGQQRPRFQRVVPLTAIAVTIVAIFGALWATSRPPREPANLPEITTPNSNPPHASETVPKSPADPGRGTGVPSASHATPPTVDSVTPPPTPRDPEPRRIEASPQRRIDVEAQLRAASDAFDSGDYEKAIEDYRKVLATDQTNAVARQGIQKAGHARATELLIQANQLHDTADYAGEIALLNKALEHDRSNAIVKQHLQLAQQAAAAEGKLKKIPR